MGVGASNRAGQWQVRLGVHSLLQHLCHIMQLQVFAAPFRPAMRAHGWGSAASSAGSANIQNQVRFRHALLQARILVHGKVTHLGYYIAEEDAARAYDRVSLAMYGNAPTNFPASQYSAAEIARLQSLDRASLQQALGVKPMQKSSRCAAAASAVATRARRGAPHSD